MKVKIIVLILLSIICTSCSNLGGQIVLDKLHDKNEKFGLMVFRPMFFETKESTEAFCSDGVFSNLTENNELSIWYKLDGSSFEGAMGKHIGVTRKCKLLRTELDDKLFVIEPRKQISLLTWKPDILRPEYFYNVEMLPEGRYYISSIAKYHTGNAYYLKKKFTKNEGPSFYIKAGKINYLGDLYHSSLLLVKPGGFFSNGTYCTSFRVCDRNQDAQAFLKKFYPEINLPFTKSLLEKHQGQVLNQNPTPQPFQRI